MKTTHCDHCNRLVFFENERCERCEARLGDVRGEMHAFEDAGEGRWRMPDGYPFALAAPVIDKLRFVHRVISASAVDSSS